LILANKGTTLVGTHYKSCIIITMHIRLWRNAMHLTAIHRSFTRDTKIPSFSKGMQPPHVSRYVMRER
jgi:hypothetical protein